MKYRHGQYQIDLLYHRFFPTITGMRYRKELLRNDARRRRVLLSADEIAGNSLRICMRLMPLLRGCDPVMLFASKPQEVDTRRLIQLLIAAGARVVVPIIEQETRTLRLSYLPDPSVLVPSTFGVPEPIGHEVPARREELRIAVVPMLAFDRSGNRLGYGAGYYDRFLQSIPSLVTIGVAFSCFEMPAVPGDGRDVRMALIVTEKELIVPARERAGD